jgi:uncharacterized protein (TIRG00374 family)
MRSKTQRLAVIFGLLISVVFLYFAFSRLNPAAVLETLRQADPVPILVGAVGYLLAIVVIAWRWGFLLRSSRRIPFKDLNALVFIGYMGNNVYPFRSGEILRIWLLQRNFGIPVARGATTVVVERILDGLVMLSFIFFALAQLDIASPEITQVANVATPLFIVGLLVFIILAAKPDWLRALVRFVARLLPGKVGDIVTNLGEDLVAGLEGLRTPADLAGTIFASYASWLIAAFIYWVVGFAFGIDQGFIPMLLVVGVVNLAGLIPASPGQIGVFEFFTATTLIATGVPEATATTYALAVHGVVWLPVTLVGFYYLLRQGLSLSAITGARQIDEQNAEAPTSAAAPR